MSSTGYASGFRAYGLGEDRLELATDSLPMFSPIRWSCLAGLGEGDLRRQVLFENVSVGRSSLRGGDRDRGL